MSKNMSAELKITRARVSLVVNQPFFGTLVMRMKMEAKPVEFFAQHKIPPTCATDGSMIYYYEPYIDSLSVPEVTGVLCHEAMHVGLLHHTRRGNRDLDRWQDATDYAVNPLVKGAGGSIMLPGDALIDKKYDKMAAEEIYHHMQSTQPQNNKGKGGGSQGFGSVIDAQGSPTDIAQQEAEWKIAMAQAVQAGKMAGNLPAGLERLVAELLEPKVDWAAQLREYLTDKKRAEDDWSRPNRRFAHRGLILPSIREEPTGELVVVVDTSGSITDKVLSAFETEIRTIATEVKPNKITVIYCDAGINKVQTFEQDDEVRLKMCGGGGTDFRPPFNYVRNNDITPHAFVYLTDGYGPFPDQKPDYPVVWCMTTDVVAPFGHHVFVKIDEY